MRCHSCSPISKKGVPELMPAAFSRMSTCPNSSSVASSARARSTLLAASAWIAMARRPNSRMDFARASAFSSIRSTIATSAPAWANPVAIAPASTPPPPMTTAICPSSEKSLSCAMRFLVCHVYSASSAIRFRPQIRLPWNLSPCGPGQWVSRLTQPW